MRAESRLENEIGNVWMREWTPATIGARPAETKPSPTRPREEQTAVPYAAESSAARSRDTCLPLRILAVTNMYPIPEDPASGVFIEQQIKGLRQAGLEVDIQLVDRDHKGMQAYFYMGGQIQEQLARSRPDVVHIMYGGVMADIVTCLIRDTPTVVTFHGSDLLGDHSSGVLKRIAASYGVRASHRAARRASGIVVVSKQLQNQLSNDIAQDKIRVIPCGIDTERFKPLDRDACRQQIGWAKDRFHVLFPANSGSPVKRPELARAVIAAATQLGLPAELHYLAGVPNDDVPVWLNASDTLLLTSLHEGSPTVVKEALACNIPIVSVDVGDVRERIEGVAGCHMASADPSDLADKLRSVAANSDPIMGQVRAQELSLRSIAQRLQDFYSETVTSFQRANPTPG